MHTHENMPVSYNLFNTCAVEENLAKPIKTEPIAICSGHESQQDAKLTPLAETSWPGTAIAS